MILSDILFQLERIANSLEVLADTKLERIPKEKAPPVEFFDSTKEINYEEENRRDLARNKMEEKMLNASKAGLFFEEDALTEQELMQL